MSKLTSVSFEALDEETKTRYRRRFTMEKKVHEMLHSFTRMQTSNETSANELEWLTRGFELDRTPDGWQTATVDEIAEVCARNGFELAIDEMRCKLKADELFTKAVLKQYIPECDAVTDNKVYFVPTSLIQERDATWLKTNGCTLPSKRVAGVFLTKKHHIRFYSENMSKLLFENWLLGLNTECVMCYEDIGTSTDKMKEALPPVPCSMCGVMVCCSCVLDLVMERNVLLWSSHGTYKCPNCRRDLATSLAIASRNLLNRPHFFDTYSEAKKKFIEMWAQSQAAETDEKELADARILKPKAVRMGVAPFKALKPKTDDAPKPVRRDACANPKCSHVFWDRRERNAAPKCQRCFRSYCSVCCRKAHKTQHNKDCSGKRRKAKATKKRHKKGRKL